VAERRNKQATHSEYVAHLHFSRTKEIFWMGFVASWGGQVPGAFLCTKYWRDDLVGLYTGMAAGYFLLVILYSIIVLRRYDCEGFCCWTDFSSIVKADDKFRDSFFHSDWEMYAKLAQERSESKGKIKEEEAIFWKKS
jgi:hypothetical protein